MMQAVSAHEAMGIMAKYGVGSAKDVEDRLAKMDRFSSNDDEWRCKIELRKLRSFFQNTRGPGAD